MEKGHSVATHRAYKELVADITPEDYPILRKVEETFPGTLGWGLAKLIK